MSDIINSLWEPLDDANVHPSPDGIAKEDNPNTVPEVMRAMKGAIKRAYLQSNAIHVSTGTGNTYVLTYPKAPEGYAKGIVYWFFADKANTGAATLNINGLGSRAILNAAGAPLLSGQIASGACVCVIYNGTAFVMQFTHSNPTFTGNVAATSFTGTYSGNGATLTDLNASNITSGTISKDRIPSALNATQFGEYVRAGTGANGYVQINAGASDKTGFVDFRQSSGERAGFIGNSDIANKLINYYSEPGYRHSFTSGDPALTPLINGEVIWYAGNDGAGSFLDADLLDGQQGAFYQSRANHTGTQPVTTITGLDAILDDPWRFQPVGSLVYATWLSGFVPPPTDKAYRYIILSAGSAYNAGVLTDEVVTGTGAATVATAKINLPASPFHGQTVRLINTTREFLRPGAPGTIQASQNKSHSHSGQTNVTGNHVHSYIQPAPGYAVGNINGTGSGGAWTTTGAAGDHAHTLIINAEGGEEAQPRSIGANVYMRIL